MFKAKCDGFDIVELGPLNSSDGPSKDVPTVPFDVVWEGPAAIGSTGFFNLNLKTVNTSTSARGTRGGYRSLSIRQNISVLQYRLATA